MNLVGWNKSHVGWTSHTSLLIAIILLSVGEMNGFICELKTRTSSVECLKILQLSHFYNVEIMSWFFGVLFVCLFFLNIYIYHFSVFWLYQEQRAMDVQVILTADWSGSNGNLINFFTGWTPKWVLMCSNNTWHFNQDFFSVRQKAINKRHRHIRTTRSCVLSVITFKGICGR